jgi:hypothetical protein
MGPDPTVPALNVAIEPLKPRPEKNEVAPATRGDPTGSEPRDEQPAPSLLLSGELVVEIDAAAGRFVQRLHDRDTDEVLRQWPNEAQLAFSRGVRAYLAALKSAL